MRPLEGNGPLGRPAPFLAIQGRRGEMRAGSRRPGSGRWGKADWIDAGNRRLVCTNSPCARNGIVIPKAKPFDLPFNLLPLRDQAPKHYTVPPLEVSAQLVVLQKARIRVLHNLYCIMLPAPRR